MGAVRAIVSLGSNIEPRADYLASALAALSRLPGTRLVETTPVEETEPVDVPGEFRDMKFLNQLAVFDTELEAHDFSRRMHAVEDALGRVRTVRNGPRTIDLDLIDFGGLVLDEPELTLPHPRAHERGFITRPLALLMAKACHFAQDDTPDDGFATSAAGRSLAPQTAFWYNTSPKRKEKKRCPFS